MSKRLFRETFRIEPSWQRSVERIVREHVDSGRVASVTVNGSRMFLMSDESLFMRAFPSGSTVKRVDGRPSK